MKEKIHPKYKPSKVTCGCGNTFTTRSTGGDLMVEVCSNCHPFFTGQQRFVDTAGRVEKFQKKYAWSADKAATQAEAAVKKAGARPKQRRRPPTELHTTARPKTAGKVPEGAAAAMGGPGGAPRGGRPGAGGGGGGRAGGGGGRGRPKREAPVSTERQRAGEPKTQEPKAEQPKTEEPKTQAPPTDPVKAEQPQAQQPPPPQADKPEGGDA